MENLLLPSKIEFIADNDNKNAGAVVISPCYHGYGATIGNTLRRVLLSSLPGAAVDAFKIKGVQHEFSAVPGVKEDAVEIILNLKQLALKVFSDESVVLTLTKKGVGPVTAGDIKKDANVEVINKDLVIANITDAKNVFDMEIIVNRGRGFKPVEEKEKKNYDLGTIIIDSSYSPIKDVGYNVEYTRVGDITNYEKLTLNIETSGAISVEESVREASQLIMDHFSIVLNGLRENGLMSIKEEDAEVKTKTEKKIKKTVKSKKKQ